MITNTDPASYEDLVTLRFRKAPKKKQRTFEALSHAAKIFFTEMGHDRCLDPMEKKAAITLFSHLVLSLCFGICQGSVIVMVTYTTTIMGETLGSYCLGILYGTFTICSLTITPVLIRRPNINLRTSYRISVIFFLIYMGLLICSNALDGKSRRILGYASSVFGGLGFSIHWNSQSLLYQLNALVYSKLRYLDVGSVNESFSGIFAALYVFFEMVAKIASSVILTYCDTLIPFFMVYCSCLFFALFLSSLLVDVAAFDVQHTALESDHYSSAQALKKMVLGVVSITLTNRNLQLLLPISMSFGITAGFLFTFYYDDTVSVYLGSSAVGIISAVGPGVCSIATPLLSVISSRCGNTVVILLGALSFIAIAMAYLIYTNEQLGNWTNCIMINFLMGLGRSVWESTNKAMYATVFSPNESSSAFASMYACTGFLTFSSLFIFPSISLRWMCVCVIIPSVAMVPCYTLITRLGEEETPTHADTSKREQENLLKAKGDGCGFTERTI